MTDILKELQAVLALLSIVNMLGLWAVAIYTWQANRKRVTNERITSLQNAMDKSMHNLNAALEMQGGRLTRVERDLKHAPTHDDLKRLHARIDEVNGSIRSLEGEFKGANSTLQLIHQYLLNNGGKKE